MNQIAKLLLEGKNCKSCIFYRWEQIDVEFCDVDAAGSIPAYSGIQDIPKEMICEKYKGR